MLMFFRIIALDIDGTLTDSGKEITPETRARLISYQQNGGRVILASGRPTQGIMPYADILELGRYGGYILSYNGGCAIDCRTGSVLFRTELPLSVIPEICEVIRDYPVGISTCEGDTIIAGNNINKYTELTARINRMAIRYVTDFPRYVSFPVNKCLLHGKPEHILELERILTEKYSGKLGVFRSEPFFLEIVPDGVDKAGAIDRLIDSLGIKAEECIACGDGFNDISMIRYAGLGIAMANASEQVKKAADYVTRSNDEDGIAYVLERLTENRGCYSHAERSKP